MAKFEIYKSGDGERWRLVSDNGKNIASGGEELNDAEKSIKNILERVKLNTPIVEKNAPADGSANTRFEYYVGKDNQYYWHLQNEGNNKNITSGGEGFSSKQSVIDSIENVREKIGTPPIERV